MPLKKATDTDDRRISARSPTRAGSTDSPSRSPGRERCQADFTKIAEEDLKKGESIGIAIALIVLIVVFASIVAAVVPRS